MSSDLSNIVSTHADFVRAVARQLLRDEDSAEDVVQQTWLALLSRGGGGSVHDIRTWLAAVVRKLVRKQRRSSLRQLTREQRAFNPDTTVDSPDSRAEAGELFKNLADAIVELPTHEREVIVLRYYHKVPTTAIATRLGLSEQIIRKRRRQAIGSLRSRLDRRYEDRSRWSLALTGVVAPSLRSSETRAPGSRPRVNSALLAVSGVGALILATSVIGAIMLRDPTQPPPVATAGRISRVPSEDVPPDARQTTRVLPRGRVRTRGWAPGLSTRLRPDPWLRNGSAPHPWSLFDRSGRFEIRDWVMVSGNQGLALVGDLDSDTWAREHSQLAAILVGPAGSTTVRLVDALNKHGVRSWGSISLAPEGICACVSLPGGNFELYLIEVDPRVPETGTFPCEPVLSAEVNPETGHPRAVIWASWMTTASGSRGVMHVVDGRATWRATGGSRSQEPVRLMSGSPLLNGHKIARLFVDQTRSTPLVYAEVRSHGSSSFVSLDISAADDPSAWRWEGPVETATLPSAAYIHPHAWLLGGH
jgi:RNA polymerase sigma factor (sigma-70 family)